METTRTFIILVDDDLDLEPEVECPVCDGEFDIIGVDGLVCPRCFGLGTVASRCARD